MLQVVGIFLFVGILICAILVGWTQDELGYVLSMIKNQPVHVPFIVGLFCNIFFNGFIFVFDFFVFVLRVCGVI